MHYIQILIKTHLYQTLNFKVFLFILVLSFGIQAPENKNMFSVTI